MTASASPRKDALLRIPILKCTSDEPFLVTTCDTYGEFCVKNTFLDFRSVNASSTDSMSPEKQPRRTKSLELDGSQNYDVDTPSTIFSRASPCRWSMTPSSAANVDDYVRASINLNIPCPVANEADAIYLTAPDVHPSRNETLTQCSTATSPDTPCGTPLASQSHPAHNGSTSGDEETIAPHIRDIVLEQTKLQEEREAWARTAIQAENVQVILNSCDCHCKQYLHGPNETHWQGHSTQHRDELHICDLIRLPVTPQQQLQCQQQHSSSHFMPAAGPALQQRQQQWQSPFFMPAEETLKQEEQGQQQQQRTVPSPRQMPNTEFTQCMNGAHGVMMPVYTAAQQGLQHQAPVFQSDCGNECQQPQGYYQEESHAGVRQGNQRLGFRYQVIEQQTPVCSSFSMSDHSNQPSSTEDQYSEMSTSHWKTGVREHAPMFNVAQPMGMPSTWIMGMHSSAEQMGMPSDGTMGMGNAELMGTHGMEPMGMPGEGQKRMPCVGQMGAASAEPTGMPCVGPVGILVAGPMGMPGARTVEMRCAEPMGIPSAKPMGISGAGPMGMHNTELRGAASAEPTGMSCGGPMGILGAGPGMRSADPMGMRSAEPMGMPGVRSVEMPGAQAVEFRSAEQTGMPMRMRSAEQMGIHSGKSVHRVRSRFNSFPTSNRYSHSEPCSHNRIPRKRNLHQEFLCDNMERAVTTIMIRNIPNRYKQSEFVEEINKNGFDGTYDFVYLPMDLSTCSNVGYAFINFIHEQYAVKAMQAFTGYRFSMYQNASKKVVCISVAHIQGFETNLKHYQQTAINDSRINEHRPLVKPVASQPAHN
eukprot:GEMP01002801.1.p1 GENE.GEMP01002801.1~~GEMP01002801.1.p1  ORF type:complete len:815 (+),score=168.30 GEMP01002801.1:36-2480(+)